MLKKLGAFVRLARFKFLIGGFLGGALGTAIACYESGALAFGAYGLAQLTITAAHLMTQLANEYYDLASDAQTERTPYSGGSGVLVEGALDPKIAIAGALACLGIAVCGAVALAATGHVVAAIVGAFIVPLAWAYSAPPLRLLARGLGEADTMLVVAVLVPLCAYAAQTGTLDARAVASTLPGAAAMLAMMITVQLPDVRADTATGKRNLVVRYGSHAAAIAGIGALVAVIGATFCAGAFGAPPAYAAYESIALVPIAFLLYGFVEVATGRAVKSARLAAFGVGVFVMVSALGALGYALAMRSPQAL